VLTLTELARRDCPAALVVDAYAAGYADRFGFVGEVQDAFLRTPAGDAHALAGLTAGNGPRVVVLDARPSMPGVEVPPPGFRPPGSPDLLASFFAFEPEFMGGVLLSTVETPGGDRLLVGAGPGGAPVVRQFDPLSGQEAGPVLVYGDLGTDRAGVGYLTAFDGSVYAMPGGPVGPRLVGFDPDAGEMHTSVFVGDPADRSGLYRPAAAGLGVAAGPGGPVAVAVEYAGDPLTTALYPLGE
jgi:hypothetical protein